MSPTSSEDNSGMVYFFALAAIGLFIAFCSVACENRELKRRLSYYESTSEFEGREAADDDIRIHD